jgi:Biotin carboxylase, N-terminal domain
MSYHVHLSHELLVMARTWSWSHVVTCCQLVAAAAQPLWPGVPLFCRSGRPAGVPRRISSLSHQIGAFVEAHGGKRPIYSILVANNGIAAVKFIRSIRKWAFTTFGSEKALTLVAMATHDDIRSNAEHIHMADQFVEVPSGPSANNYGNVKLITQTALQAAVDAVWPGWCGTPCYLRAATPATLRRIA